MKANTTGSQLLALDSDTRDERSHFSTPLEDPLIAQHAGLLHATASATLTQPRSRIIFLLDEVLETADYEVALNRVYGRPSSPFLALVPSFSSLCFELACCTAV